MVSLVAACSDRCRAVSVNISPTYDCDTVPLRVVMDNGEDMTVLCSTESLLSLEHELQRHRFAARARKPLPINDDIDEFADNAAGS